MQCGVACLAMVCRWHGLNISLEQLEQECTPTTEGVSLKGMTDAARSLGFDTGSGRVSAADLCNVPLPAILHWDQNHFVVLYEVDKQRRRFWIADPAKGKYRVSVDELKKHWLSTRTEGTDKGIAMLLEPAEGFGTVAGEQPRPRTLRFLWGYFRKYRKCFLQIILGLLTGCLLELVLPFLTQWIVDLGIAHRDIGLIWLILLGELTIVVGRTAMDFIRRRLLLHISMRITISLVSDFFVKLLRLPMSFFDTKLMGDLLQRINDHQRVQTFMTGQVLGVMFTMLSFMVFGVVLLVYDPLIFGIFAAGSVAYALWIARFMGRRKVLDYELFDRQAVNHNRTYQMITSMQEIKLQGCEERRREEWEDSQADLFDVQLRSLGLQQTQEAGSVLINEIKNILITVFAATAVIDGHITLGAMLAIQFIVGQLNSPVEKLMTFIYSLQDVKISLERINEIHLRREEETSANNRRDFGGGRAIELRDVDFKYDRHSLRKTIDGVSLTIPEGKVTAIVGASGSGKTTLIKLMLGYYPVLSGEIGIGGTDINRYDLKWWRRQCGVVMQDGVIFSESVARNIAVADGEVDTGRLEQAARTACIHDFIMSLPLKYNTRIGRDGVGLSQGQKQRILIARAVYKQPDFIFLDEATNSLDAANERAIVDRLADFYRGRTVVIVAHRLSTVRDADNIAVLEGGRVAESGTHEELIARRGAYYNLITSTL